MVEFADYALGSVADIPARIAQFAAVCGWTATTPSASQAVIRKPRFDPALHPNDPDGDLYTDPNGTTAWHLEGYEIRGITTTSFLDPKTGARFNYNADVLAVLPDNSLLPLAGMMVAPSLGPAPRNVPNIPKPTKLWAFGSSPDEYGPWLGFVVEYGFNQYRHLYFGTMDRAGKYSGGDIFSATGHTRYNSGSRSTVQWVSFGLFKGYQNFPANVELSHAGRNLLAKVPGGLKYGGLETGNVGGDLANIVVDRLFGGHGDGMDDLLVAHGFADYAGENLIFPATVYLGVQRGVDGRIRACGAPRGVRNINMKNLEPGQIVVVGNQQYRVFPVSSKQAFSTDFMEGPDATASGTANGWPRVETSAYNGHAYPMGEVL